MFEGEDEPTVAASQVGVRVAPGVKSRERRSWPLLAALEVEQSAELLAEVELDPERVAEVEPSELSGTTVPAIEDATKPGNLRQWDCNATPAR